MRRGPLLGGFAVSIAVLTANAVAQDAGKLPATTPPASRLLDARFEATALLEPPFSPEALHGLALRRLADGELAIAARALDELVAETADGDAARPLLERDRGRAHALIELRNAFFARCRDDGVKLRVEIDGRTRVATIQSVDADGLTLALAKGETTGMAFDELGIEALVKVCEEQKLELGSPATHALAQFLAGRKNWKRAAGGTSPAELALLEDEGALTRLLALGSTVAEIEKLARIPVETAALDTAQRALATLQELWKTEAGADLVAERAAALRQLAIQMLGRSFTLRGLSDPYWDERIRGRFEGRESGRARITWTFDGPEELEDWTVLSQPDPYGIDLATPDDEARLTVEDDALRASGKHYLRSALQFVAPISLTWRVVYTDPSAPGEPEKFTLLQVILGERGNRIVAGNADDLVSVDEGQLTRDQDTRRYRFHTPYTIVLEHDGTKAELSLTSHRTLTVPGFGADSGYVSLYFFTDAGLRLEEFCIDGVIAPASFLAWQDDWIESELARLMTR